MEPKKHYLSVKRSARYFTLGHLSERIREIWILFHGYGQLADQFLNHCHGLLREDRFLVAPEGLSRFYQRKGRESQSIGASWMTKEERLIEISDYLQMIEQIVDRIRVMPAQPDCRLMGLGFSQGTATLTRWALWSKHPMDALVLYGGDFAYDIDLQELGEKLPEHRCYLIAGDQDPFMGHERFAKMCNKVEQCRLAYDEIHYQGAHEIHTDALATLSELTDYYHSLRD